MKQIEIEITGISPLLMHRYPLQPIESLEKKTPEEQAEFAAYRDPHTRNLYIPGDAIQRALVAAATYSKGKGRASLQKVAAACLLVSPERINLGVQSYEIDSRRVVMPATKGSVVRHRPKLFNWKAAFMLDYDEDLLTSTQINRILNDAGSRVGILDYRPEKKGSFGRFIVTRFNSRGAAEGSGDERTA